MYETSNYVYIVQELVTGGQLMQQINDRGIFTEVDAIKVLKSLLEVVEYLHSKNIMHRDLKPENILLKMENNLNEVRVVDFGLATKNDVQAYIFRRCGTPGYAAPEVLNGEFKDKYSLVCDIFSVGVIFFMMYLKNNHLKCP